MKISSNLKAFQSHFNKTLAFNEQIKQNKTENKINKQINFVVEIFLKIIDPFAIQDLCQRFSQDFTQNHT